MRSSFSLKQTYRHVLTLAEKNHPAIERGCALLAATAGLDADGIRSALDNVAKSNLAVIDESR